MEATAPALDVPAPLMGEWRRIALHAMRRAIVGEELFGRTGAVNAAVLAVQRSAASSLPPSVEELRGAVAARKPVWLLDKAHWPTGWLHYLGARESQDPRAAELVDVVASTLTEELAAVVARLGRGRQLRVDEVTRVLTDTIAGWAYGQDIPTRDRRWNLYRELSLPVTPGGSTRFGRLDVTVMRPDGPDIVVEIDSTHKEQSVEKLTFARDAGAVAVWVRRHGGRVALPDGVEVIDLVEATRGLAG